MRSILLDTDIIIEILRKNITIAEEVKGLYRTGKLICFSPVTKAEVYHGIRPKEEIDTSHLFSRMTCLLIDDVIGEKAGKYLKNYHKSHNLQLGDALIAATANANKAFLFTLNHKHYPMKDIQFYKAKSHTS